jgi:hypothetical protein
MHDGDDYRRASVTVMRLCGLMLVRDQNTSETLHSHSQYSVHTAHFKKVFTIYRRRIISMMKDVTMLKLFYTSGMEHRA